MPPASPSPRLCIFDLDGTLVDSLRDIAESLNECLELLGLPAHPIERYRYMVGEGVPTLCRRAIGDSHPHLLQRLIELARPRYRTRPLRHSRPYGGVSELVTAIRNAGVRLAVLSNKPHDMTVQIVRAFWGEDTFTRIQGYVREEHRKPSPFHVLEICQGLGVPPAETCLVGDTPTDITTARRAGANVVAVTWGFRTRADLQQSVASDPSPPAAGSGRVCIVDTPAEVLNALGLSP